jgi:hypothetical protein
MKWILYLVLALINAGMLGYIIAKHKLGYSSPWWDWTIHSFFLFYFFMKAILIITILINKK